MAFRMFSSRDRNLILGRVLLHGGVTILLTTISLPTMMKTLTMMIPLMTTMTMRIAITTKMVKMMMTPMDWTTPLMMTTTTSSLMLISRNLS